MNKLLGKRNSNKSLESSHKSEKVFFKALKLDDADTQIQVPNIKYYQDELSCSETFDFSDESSDSSDQ